MTKVFEDYFMDIQADMVSLCLEYSDSKAEKIYIYASNENNAMTFNFFLEVNNRLVTSNNVNSALPKEDGKIDDSIDRRRAVLKIGVEDLQRINSICEEYNQPVPTEMKLTYDVISNSLDAKYKYNKVYSNTNNSSYDVFNEWFEEIDNVK